MTDDERRERKRERDRRYREANRERVRESHRRWRAESPERSREYDRRRREENPEKYREANRRWREANPEKAAEQAREYDRRWREENSEKIARKATIRRAAGTVTDEEIAAILAKPCAYCHGPSEHVDHILAVSRGGTSDPANLTGACAACNLSKGSKLMRPWALQRFGAERSESLALTS